MIKINVVGRIVIIFEDESKFIQEFSVELSPVSRKK